MKKIWLDNYPKNIPHEIPKLDKTLLDLFEETCERHKNKPAFVSLDTQLTYKDLHQKVLDLASFLQNDLGLKKGDVIIIQSPNLFAYPISLWAALYSGLIVVNMNPLYSSREMKEQINDSNAKAIIILSNCITRLENIIQETNLKNVIISQPGDLIKSPKNYVINFVFKYIQKKAPRSHSLKFTSFPEALKKGSKKSSEIRNRALDEIAFLQYTGGTTGMPRGVELTQKNILSNLKQCELWLVSNLKRGEGTALNALPLYHIFSLLINGMLLFLYGMTNVMQANPRDIPQLINVLKKYPMTLMIGVNTLFKVLMEHPKFEQIDFSLLKFSVSGGMSTESSTQERWLKITKTPIIEGYGLTEASPVVCCNDLTNPKNGFIGFPLPSTEIRIVDNDGNELEVNQEGELEVRGPQVMQGYFNHPEETKKVINQDGWLKTGDIACVTPEGLVKILDRKKDLVIVSGFNVYPNEVENVLSHHKKIKEVVIVGIPSKKSGEAIKAFVVKKDDDLTKEETKKYCKSRLAAYKVPYEVQFVEEIPKTTIGKPIRYKMKG